MALWIYRRISKWIYIFLRPGILSEVKKAPLLRYGSHMSGKTMGFIIYSSYRRFHIFWRRTFGQEAIHHSISPQGQCTCPVPVSFWPLVHHVQTVRSWVLKVGDFSDLSVTHPKFLCSHASMKLFSSATLGKLYIFPVTQTQHGLENWILLLPPCPHRKTQQSCQRRKLSKQNCNQAPVWMQALSGYHLRWTGWDRGTNAEKV